MKRYTERIRENEYATGNAIIKELNIDENNKDKSYLLEQQKNIINTLNNKLGKLEDLEEQLGCPFHVIKHLINELEFFYEDEYGIHLIYSYSIGNNTINFEADWQDHDIEVGDFGGIELPFTEYKKSFWLKKDKSE